MAVIVGIWISVWIHHVAPLAPHTRVAWMYQLCMYQNLLYVLVSSISPSLFCLPVLILSFPLPHPSPHLSLSLSLSLYLSLPPPPVLSFPMQWQDIHCFVDQVNSSVQAQEETERVKEAMSRITAYHVVDVPSELKDVSGDRAV